MSELDLIRKKIRVHLNEIADDLASGCATSYEQYRYLTGMIAGLALVERDIVDMMEARKDED